MRETSQENGYGHCVTQLPRLRLQREFRARVDEGPGYRVYYAIAGKQIALLLCGGAKTTQSSDIENAIRYWEDWNARLHSDEQKNP